MYLLNAQNPFKTIKSNCLFWRFLKKHKVSQKYLQPSVGSLQCTSLRFFVHWFLFLHGMLCSKQLQMRPCSEAAWASIFVPFHLLGKSWTRDYFFRCQQYPVIIPLLTYNCLVAESLPSQQWWAQRWRHLFTETEVWEQINSRFGKGWGGRGTLSLNTSISSLRQARQYRKMPHTALQCYLKWTSQNHTEAVF